MRATKQPNCLLSLEVKSSTQAQFDLDVVDALQILNMLETLFASELNRKGQSVVVDTIRKHRFDWIYFVYCAFGVSFRPQHLVGNMT